MRTANVWKRIAIPKIRRRKPSRPTPGAVPGTLAPVPEATAPTITRFEYDGGRCEVSTIDPGELEGALTGRPGAVVWIDVQGLGDTDLLRRLAVVLGLHPLLLEDIVHLHERPKLEDDPDHLFTVMRRFRSVDGHIENEQLSCLLRGNLLITFQERPGDGFDPVRRRLREDKGTIRRRGADYLLYALLDSAIDDYFPVLELYGDTMDSLDEELRARPDPALAEAVHTMRRELRQLRRAIWPLRDVVNALSRGGASHVDAALATSFRDCYDHVAQLADLVESFRERAADLAGLYQTMIGERTNQVMKVLTIIATIFIPLTFLCGLYGMNFDTSSPFNMPELRWRYGYIGFWAVTVGTLVGMLWFFARKGWLGRGR